MPDYKNDPDVLIETAKWAVNNCVFNALKGRATRTVKFKNDNPTDPVTNVDLENSAIMQKAFAPYIAEGAVLIDEETELTMSLDEIFADPARLVIITDPIDGTRAFNSDDGKSWGTMLTMCRGMVPFYSSVVMPEMLPKGWLEMDISKGQCHVGKHGKWEEIPSHLYRLYATDGYHVANVSHKMKALRKTLIDHDIKVVSGNSAAETILNLAQGHSYLAGMNSGCSIWDVAPMFHLAELHDHTVVFESKPREKLSFGPHLFKKDGKLKDCLIVTTPALHNRLYPALAA